MLRYAVCSGLVVLLAALSLEAACPTAIKTMKNFDIKQYLGHWYEIERYPSVLESAMKCITIDHIPYADPTTFRVEERSLLIFNNQPVSDIRNGSVLQSANTAEIQWGGAKVFILDSDYTNFAAIWSCGGSAIFPDQQDAWILSRTATLADNFLQRAHDSFTRTNLTVPSVKAVRDDNCKP